MKMYSTGIHQRRYVVVMFLLINMIMICNIYIYIRNICISTCIYINIYIYICIYTCKCSMCVPFYHFDIFYINSFSSLKIWQGTTPWDVRPAQTHPETGAPLPCDRRVVYKQLKNWYGSVSWPDQWNLLVVHDPFDDIILVFFSCNLLLHAVCFSFHESFQDKTLKFSYKWNMALCWRMVQSANVDAWTFLITTYVLNCQWSCVQLVVVGTSPILCALELAVGFNWLLKMDSSKATLRWLS